MKRITSPADAHSFVSSYKHFLFDCDGVVWLDQDVVPGTIELLDHLTKNGITYAFVTNNLSVSRSNYIKKFRKLGFKNITKDQIFPTSYSAALVLDTHLGIPKKSKVWVLGDEGIEHELEEAGYIPVGGTDVRLDDEWDPNHPLLEVDPEVRAVVVGSTKKLNYLRISTTVQYLLHERKSLPFIGTNIDRTYPGLNGRILPAGGSVVYFMKYTADRDFIEVGKPAQILLDSILESTGFDREKTVMVGDTLYTDIKFGNDGDLGGGKSSLLVLSGGTKRHDIENGSLASADVSTVPSFVVESLGHLKDLLE